MAGRGSTSKKVTSHEPKVEVLDSKAGMRVEDTVHGLTVEKRAELASIAMAARARAKVEASYIVASRNQRNEDEARARILERCQEKEFAEEAIYEKPVGGTRARGLTIRFVEEMLRLWGNISANVEEIYDDDDKRVITVEVRDYQTNYAIGRELTLNKTVERHKADNRVVLGERLNTKGETVFIVQATEDEMAVKEAAQVSKVIRQLGLKMLPADVKKECFVLIDRTRRSDVKKDPQAAKKQVLDAFQQLGVYPRDVEKLVGQSVRTLSPVQIQRLREIYTAIKEGHTTWREVMETKNRKPSDDEGNSGPSLEGLFPGDLTEHQEPGKPKK